MEPRHVERRRGRRVPLAIPIMIRQGTGRQPQTFEEEATRDISLAGVYFETERESYAVDDILMTSVVIPDVQTRLFPFSRLAGRSRVVRVDPLPQPSASGRKRFGVALEFGDDFTVLAALPARG
ncbi:MAG: PilZ domain-containing protein [Candidatus Omnitrophica bacterium]|nr:PilZ domain-containing protein [Candidatus Omnitrophota bacterium]